MEKSSFVRLSRVIYALFFAFLNIFVVKYTNKNKKETFVTQKYCKKQEKIAYFPF